jgi:hypothetical protein
MQNSRKGEKIGWIGGWAGAFLWLWVLSLVWLARGRAVEGSIGLGLGGLAAVLIWVLRPWRHPDTPFWKLLIPLYAAMGMGATWAVESMGSWVAIAKQPWGLLAWLPVLLPLFLLGRRRWRDGDLPQSDKK